MGIAYNQIPIPAGLSLLRRMADINPLIVNYHIVSDDSLPYIRNLYRYRDVSTFKKDIEFLVSRYQPIGLLDLLGSMRGEVELPKNALMFTFDDGFKELHDVVAPVFIDAGVSATFFITRNLIDNKELLLDSKKSLLIDRLRILNGSHETGEVEELIRPYHVPGHSLNERIQRISYRDANLVDEIAPMIGVDFDMYLKEKAPYLSSPQITSLVESGFTFGGHSIDHPRYSDISLEDQIRQTNESIEFLEKSFSLDYRAFAFPYTDKGVSKAFFQAISSNVDVTFGTQGLFSDAIPTNFQRISLEKHNASASKTIKFHYMRRIIYKKRKREVIQRS